jgi:hypothetical protein
LQTVLFRFLAREALLGYSCIDGIDMDYAAVLGALGRPVDETPQTPKSDSRLRWSLSRLICQPGADAVSSDVDEVNM